MAVVDVPLFPVFGSWSLVLQHMDQSRTHQSLAGHPFYWGEVLLFQPRRRFLWGARRAVEAQTAAVLLILSSLLGVVEVHLCKFFPPSVDLPDASSTRSHVRYGFSCAIPRYRHLLTYVASTRGGALSPKASLSFTEE